MIGKDTDKIIEELFDPLWHRYQTGSEKSMRDSKFVFNHVDCIASVIR